MQDDLALRKEEGSELRQSHLAKAEESATLFLATLKGFRRDLGLSMQSCPEYIEAEFTALTNLLAVPPLAKGAGFADLGEFLHLADDALEGTIRIRAPKRGPDRSEAKKVLEEVDMIHKNLADVSDSAHRLYQCLQTAGFEFDVFNSKNIEVGHPELNITDELYLPMTAARAIAERAVRLDIDLMGQKEML